MTRAAVTTPAGPKLPVRYEIRLPCRPKTHRVYYGPDGVTFLDHTETELAFLQGLGAAARCSCAGVYQDVQDGYVAGPGAHMPAQAARRFLQALVEPLAVSLEVVGLRCFIGCDIPTGAKAPAAHVYAYFSPPGGYLAEISGKGIRVNRNLLERAAEMERPGSLCAETTHCRPCRFIASGPRLAAHLQSETHLDTVCQLFLAAFPPASVLE